MHDIFKECKFWHLHLNLNFFHILFEADRLQQLSLHIERYVDDFLCHKSDVSKLKLLLQ